jgi:ElaB/YqjD/DUF883 family membrane-anchored ribosome-binding protein
MDDRNQASRETIAAEAVGERGRSATPDFAREKAEMSPDEAVRKIATPSESRANLAGSAAESLGERVGDAYPDAANRQTHNLPRKVAQQANDLRAGSRQAAQNRSHQFNEPPLMTVVAGLALGYIAGLLMHGRR